MRFLELELESLRLLDEVDPPLHGILCFCAPTDQDVILCDRPAGASSRLTFVPGSGRPRTWDLNLDFAPHLLADDDEGRVLAVGTGGECNAELLSLEGSILRRYGMGPAIADVAFDPDGNILALRAVRNAPHAWLDRYGPDGDRVERDAQITRIMGHTTQKVGVVLLIQNDGALWLNLTEKYDADGTLLDVIEPARDFGPGRVCADRFAWDGIVVLAERGDLTAVLPRGEKRRFHLPEQEIRSLLGRPLSASRDLIVSRGERLWVLVTDRPRLLSFRMLSE
ncbi:MAG: hypothetical protein HY716_09665 [Planctomycetes bacterium]|nr:hypothetical protein [Planctomycetota bacterium]